MAKARRGRGGRYGARADLLGAGRVPRDLLDDAGLLHDAGLLDVLPEDDQPVTDARTDGHPHSRATGATGDLDCRGAHPALGGAGAPGQEHPVPLPLRLEDLPVPVRILDAGSAPVGVVDLDLVPRHQWRWLTRGAKKLHPDLQRDAEGAAPGVAAQVTAAEEAQDRPASLGAVLDATADTHPADAAPRFAAPPAPRTSEEDPPGERRRGRRGTPTAPEADPDVMELPAPQGYVLRRSARKARRGWYAPVAVPALTSTRQASILNTALVAAPTTAEGILIGRDRLSNTQIAHDPFSAYEKRTITSPAVVVLGVIGAGKSSLLKTVYVLRPLILRNRRAVVMDRKDRGGEGEYCATSRQMGAEPFRFVVGGGGTRLNVLDPVVLAGSGEDRGEQVAGQARLLIALAELANDGGGLDKWEKAALRFAHKATLREADAEGTVPVLEDLLRHLGRVTDIAQGRRVTLPDFTDYSRPALERMHQAGLGVHHLMSALLSDELSGLFDGPTSKDVRLAEKLTVFDVSQLPDEGPAVSMVMALANVWLLGTLRRHRGLRTNFIAEEGWELVGGPGGRVFQRNSKLARGLGLSNIASMHHVADTPLDDPAVAMLKEAQTVHLFRQDRDDDIEAVIRLYNLDPGSRGTLANLAEGHHLLKIGNQKEIHVQHVRSRLETGLTNTDEAMVTTGRQRGLAGAR